ncbi:MAG: 2-polyprenyl-3-methyl-5-hydroxy-6-metoxy-1,4-benzoquinol methylase [Mariniblastus sp.]
MQLMSRANGLSEFDRDWIADQSLPAPLRNLSLLVNSISQVSQVSVDVVHRRMRDEYAAIGTNVSRGLAAQGIEPFIWSSQLERFYEQTDAFLYESTVWNLTLAKCRMRTWIGTYLKQSEAKLRVLAFGDGMGFDSLFLDSIGIDVTYFDVSKLGLSIAQRMFAEATNTINIVTDPQDLREGSFDVIVCLDVLEHVDDPPALVRWLRGLLRTDGRLIVNAPFFLTNSTVKTHLKSNRKFAGDYQTLYEGMTVVAGRMFWDPIVLENSQSQSVPARLAWGATMLRASRWWATPFSLASQAIIRRKHPLVFA